MRLSTFALQFEERKDDRNLAYAAEGGLWPGHCGPWAELAKWHIVAKANREGQEE